MQMRDIYPERQVAQPKLTKIQVTYFSRYNGCSVMLYVEGEVDPLDEYEVKRRLPHLSTKVNAVQDAIVEQAYHDCDEDGEFQGIESRLRAFAISAVQQHFGAAIPIEFNIDEHSS